MRRVAKPGGRIAIIEPDFGTNVINVPTARSPARCSTTSATPTSRRAGSCATWPRCSRDQGFHDIEVATRIVVFTPELAAGYFTQTGRSASRPAAIDAAGLERWSSTIADLQTRGRLFAAIGYYLFTATA